MQSYAIKLKNALLGLSFYIFLHILQSYNFPHAATPPSTAFTNAKIPTQRFHRISEPGFLIPIYQLIFPKLGIPLFIQRLVFRVLTLVLRNDLLHLAHYLHVVEGLSYA